MNAAPEIAKDREKQELEKYEEELRKKGEKALRELNIQISLEALRHDDRGLNFRDQKRYKEAEREFKKAIQIDPKNANFHDDLSNLYRLLGHKEEAEKEYDLATFLALDWIHEFAAETRQNKKIKS